MISLVTHSLSPSLKMKYCLNMLCQGRLGMLCLWFFSITVRVLDNEHGTRSFCFAYGLHSWWSRSQATDLLLQSTVWWCDTKIIWRLYTYKKKRYNMLFDILLQTVQILNQTHICIWGYCFKAGASNTIVLRCIRQESYDLPFIEPTRLFLLALSLSPCSRSTGLVFNWQYI